MKYIGEIVNAEKWQEETAAGRGGYIIALTNEEFLNCWNFRHVCMASYANDPRRCWNILLGKQAKANCKCTMNPRDKSVSLKAIRDIGAHQEILWIYGDKYVFPSTSSSSANV